jgi:hypothetical protein
MNYRRKAVAAATALKGAAEPQTKRFVRAGLALPLWYVRGIERGQGKPSPYETLKMFAKKQESRILQCSWRGRHFAPLARGKNRPYDLC